MNTEDSTGYTFPCTQDGCKGTVSKIRMRKLTIDSDGERWEDYKEWQCDSCEWTQRAAGENKNGG